MTLRKVFAKVISDDLNSFIYNAGIVGCRSNVDCLPSSFSISDIIYSENLPNLHNIVMACMLSIIDNLK